MTAPKKPLADDPNGSDEQLIQRVLAGERECFRELMQRHKNIVFSSIMRLVGSRQLAEELAQETFVKAYTSLNTFRFEARFSTWLVQIAVNSTSNYFSSRAFRERRQSVSFEHEFHAAASDSVEAELALRRRLEMYWRALEKLPARLREVLLLCGIEGNPYEDVARLLGIPIGTVRSRLNKARLTMRQLVSEEERRQ